MKQKIKTALVSVSDKVKTRHRRPLSTTLKDLGIKTYTELNTDSVYTFTLSHPAFPIHAFFLNPTFNLYTSISKFT